MLLRRRVSLALGACSLVGSASLLSGSLLCGSRLAAQAIRSITTPKQAIGFNIGDDYHMANYDQLVSYFQTLAKESDRMKLVDIGPTAEGRRMYMAIISSPENLQKMDQYREIARKLAHPEAGMTDDEAHKLAVEGKAVVWIDGGLHASETVGAQQLIETVYMLNSATDAEMERLLRDDIVLCTLINPDGMELVANWYNREPVPEKRVADGPAGGTPRLWHKYIGHDDNRDFYLNAMPETTNISRILFREWFPQIVYNHHQAGPQGTVIFMPPFRDPFNYNYDPLIPVKIEAVGTAMHERLIEENKPGSTMRSGANYSTWYNGGLRTITYFHNEVGLLTEIIGSPNPAPVPLIPNRQLPSNDLPDPVAPQMWHYRQSIDYETTNNRAVLDYASREKEHLLYDTYLMAKNSIARGSTDSWTVTPKRITALEEAAAKEAATNPGRGRGAQNYQGVPAGSTGSSGATAGGGVAEGSRPVDAGLYKTVLHDPADRDPRGYVLPSDQPDFPTATKFVNALIKSGVTVEQASAPFTVGSKQYPAGSYVVMTAQPYRPQVLDMFERQDHPNDFAYPGGPPNRPYDATGWTLAKQMGVVYDRILDPFQGPFKAIATESDGALAKPLAGSITGDTHGKGFLVSHSYNDSFTLSNRLLKAGLPVAWVTAPMTAGGQSFAPGALWIPASAGSRKVLETAVHDLGINAVAVATAPAANELHPLHTQRIALYDQYGGLMPSGWLRWLFEQFEFPYTVVYPQTLDAGELRSKFDVLVFSDGAIREPARGPVNPEMERYGRQPKPEEIPAEFRPWLGTITADKTMPQIREFAESGGTVLAIGSSTALATYLKLPVDNALVEMNRGVEQPISPEHFYIPGSLLRTQVDVSRPIAYGMQPTADVFFDHSPAFRLAPDAEQRGVETIAWYGKGNLLDSGWAWGQQYLNDSVAVAEVHMGKGAIVLYGPEVTFRGQPAGTFKLLFNGLQYGAPAGR